MKKKYTNYVINKGERDRERESKWNIENSRSLRRRHRITIRI